MHFSLVPKRKTASGKSMRKRSGGLDEPSQEAHFRRLRYSSERRLERAVSYLPEFRVRLYGRRIAAALLAVRLHEAVEHRVHEAFLLRRGGVGGGVKPCRRTT